MIKIYKYYIGIDSGVNTGFASWHKPQKKLLQVETVLIHQAMQTIRTMHAENPGEIFVRVEDARLRKVIPRQKNEKAERGRAAGAGSVKRDASIWEGFLIDIGVDYEMVAPKDNRTKMDAKLFKKITGWQERTNEHSRDAAWLVYGK